MKVSSRIEQKTKAPGELHRFTKEPSLPMIDDGKRNTERILFYTVKHRCNVSLGTTIFQRYFEINVISREFYM